MTPAMRPLPRPDRLTLQIVSIALLGIALVLARSAGNGAGLTGEAIDYLAAARNALAGTGLLQVDGEPLASQPPLYPLLLCVADLGGFDPLAIVRWINVGLFGLTIFVVGSYLRRHLESRSLVIWGCLALAFSTPLADLASRSLAEPLFILLATLALMRANDFLTDDRVSAVRWTAAFSSLAWLTSYFGVAVVAAIGLLLVFQRGVSWPQRTGRIALYLAVATLPMGLWLLRNQLLIGAWADLPQWVERDPWSVVAAIGNAVGRWVDFDLPLVAWPNSLALTVVVTVAPLGLAGLVLYRAWRFPRPPSDWRPVWSFCTFGLAYLTLIVAVAGWWYSPVGDHAKQLAPLYVPLLAAVAFALDRLLGLERKTGLLGSVPRRWPVGRSLSTAADTSAEVPASRQSALIAILTVILVIWLAGQIVPNAEAIARERESARRWANSETLRYVRDNPIDGTIYSADIWRVYLANAGRATYIPLRVHPARAKTTTSRASGQLAEAADDAHLIWFRDQDHGHPFDLPRLRATPRLAPLIDLADGALLTVGRSDGSASNPFRESLARIRAGGFGGPAARSVFDIYREGRTLIYVKKPCTLDDTVATFSLHFTQIDGHIDGTHFRFHESGALLDGDTCVLMARLPDQPIKHIRTGQLLAREPWYADPDVADLAMDDRVDGNITPDGTKDELDGT